MTESIADVVLAALSGLKRLLETVRESDDLSLRTSLLSRLDDELARLKVWAGNSGAHRTGRASLEHRLRDASHIRQQVLRLLNDLKVSLEDAADIMTGKAMPWEEVDDDEEPLDDLETETEMEQIALDITELVDCLLRLSVSIQNPAPHDRFMSSNFTDTSAYEEFDIQHVQAKFPNIDKGLAQRLGKAMSRRRQYFKYREAHHQKLSHGLDRHGDTNKTDAPSTLASSIPLHMKKEFPIDLSGEDTQSDGRASVTSFATSVSRPKTLKVPPMPADALKGPFMCPFCYLIISVQDTRAWKKHVFGDIRPYSCLALHCMASDREFSRRNEWMQHMLQNHLRVYRCPYGCADSFSSAAGSRGHLLRAHSGAIPGSKVDSIVELSSRPLAQDANTECPFCPEKPKSLKQYRRHVGNHQQDLALFVLPNIEDGDGDSEESHSISGHESDDISFSAHDEEQFDTIVQNQETGTEEKEPVVRQLDSEDGLVEDNHQDVPVALAEIRDELNFIKRMKGGRLNSLNTDFQQPLETSSRLHSQSHSRSNSIKRDLKYQLPDNIDQNFPLPRGFTSSTPLSVSSRYDEPFSAWFSEEETSLVNPEQSSHSEIPNTHRRQSVDRDQGKQPAQRPLRGAHNDDLVDNKSGTEDAPSEDPSRTYGIEAEAGNKRRASSPPDTDSNLKEELLRQRPPESKWLATGCSNCRRRNIACLEGEYDSRCWNCNHEGLECVPDNVLASSSPKLEPDIDENQDASSQIPFAEASAEATEADNERTKANVLYNFIAKAPNELAVDSGDIVDILHNDDGGWSLAKNENDRGPGWIPTTYVNQQEPPTQELPTELIWMAEQCKGLAEGLKRIHRPKNHPEAPVPEFDLNEIYDKIRSVKESESSVYNQKK